MKVKRLIIRSSICVVLVLASPSFMAINVNAERKTLTIGAIMPLSGPIGRVGLAIGRGWELYFDKVNAKGGVKIGDNNYLINFILEDDKFSPEGAATAAIKLVHRDRAKFVFGAIRDAAAQAIYEVCAPQKVLHLVSYINAPGIKGDVSPKKPLCVRLNTTGDNAQPLNYDNLIKTYPNVKTVAICAPDSGYEPMIESAKSVAKERGIEVVSVEKFPVRTVDFSPIYIRILERHPDAVHSMVSAFAGQQLKAVRELGFKGPFFSDSPLGPDLIFQVAGPKASTDVFCNGMDLTAPEVPSAMREVMERWQTKYREAFVSDALLGWDEGWILVQALEKAQSVDPEMVLATLESMIKPGSLQTVFGPAHMGGLRTFGVNRVLVKPFPLTKIMNGKISFMKFWLPDVP